MQTFLVVIFFCNFEETSRLLIFFGTVFEPSINTGLNCVRSVSHEMSQSHGGSVTIAPELFHSHTNARTLFSASSHNASYNPLPLPKSSAVCSLDCVLNHEHVLTTQFSDLLGVVEALPHLPPSESHIILMWTQQFANSELTAIIINDA
jgi:hypothetical protein